VLVDAMVIRSTLLPALMVMLGRSNWWPGRVAPPTPAGLPSPEGTTPAPPARLTEWADR
jgi:RND superfamily putative drug exporter